jgi:hypothetical protein
MKLKAIGSFKEELDDCQQYESPGLRDRMDELFGKDMDCISVVGIGYIKGRAVSIARMILPKPPNTAWRPTKIEMKYGYDGKYRYFTLLGKEPDVGVVLASEYGEETLEFINTAKKNNLFVIEIISPGEHHKIIVQTNSGKVLDWVKYELSQLEYEKHLGGMYHGTQEEKRTQGN